jgi:hypothetical protein
VHSQGHCSADARLPRSRSVYLRSGSVTAASRQSQSLASADTFSSAAARHKNSDRGDRGFPAHNSSGKTPAFSDTWQGHRSLWQFFGYDRRHRAPWFRDLGGEGFRALPFRPWRGGDFCRQDGAGALARQRGAEMDQKLTDWLRDSRPIGAPAQPHTFPEAYAPLARNLRIVAI